MERELALMKENWTIEKKALEEALALEKEGRRQEKESLERELALKNKDWSIEKKALEEEGNKSGLGF